MIEKINSFKLIYQSIYSEKAYRKIFFTPNGRGIKYIIFLCMITSLLTLIYNYDSFSKFDKNIKSNISYDKIIDSDSNLQHNLNVYLKFFADLPNIQIENQQFISDPSDYKLVAPFERLIYFNGLQNSSEIAETDASVIFSKDAVVINRSDGQVIITLAQLIENLQSQNKIKIIDINYYLDLLGKFPLVEIQGDKLTANLNDYYIKDLYSQDKIYINTNIKEFDFSDNNLAIIILQDKVYFKRSDIGDYLLNINKNNDENSYKGYNIFKIEDVNERNVAIIINNAQLLFGSFDKFILLISFIYLLVIYTSKSILICFVVGLICKYLLQRNHQISVNKIDLQRLVSFAYLPVIMYEFILNIFLIDYDFIKLIILSIIYGYYIYFSLKSVFLAKYLQKNNN